MIYTFKKFNDEYLDEVLDIYTYYVEKTTCTFHAIALNKEEMKELMVSEDNRFSSFVILDRDFVCGYVMISKYKNRKAYDTTGEVSVYLRQDHTGKGIGKYAIDFIEKFAVKMEFHALIATVSGENNKSIRLFEGKDYIKCAHFKEIGKKFGKWLDVHVYEKIIS